MILKHYYHIYCDGLWKTPVTCHLMSLQESKLLETLEGEFYVGLVGSESNRQTAKEFLELELDKVTVVTEEARGWEQITQNKLYEDCLSSEEPFKVFYAHTKGAANVSPINDAWREIMTDTTVCRWPEAVDLLDSYDAVGALWLLDSRGSAKGGVSIGRRGFFAGTFWWANSTYIADLGYPRKTCRWDAEGWIGESARIVDHRGTTRALRQLPPPRNIRIYDMYEPVPNLARHFQAWNRKPGERLK